MKKWSNRRFKIALKNKKSFFWKKGKNIVKMKRWIKRTTIQSKWKKGKKRKTKKRKDTQMKKKENKGKRQRENGEKEAHRTCLFFCVFFCCGKLIFGFGKENHQQGPKDKNIKRKQKEGANKWQKRKTFFGGEENKVKKMKDDKRKEITKKLEDIQKCGKILKKHNWKIKERKGIWNC